FRDNSKSLCPGTATDPWDGVFGRERSLQQELADRIAIADLINRYNILGDRGRVTEMVDLFTPDAHFYAVGKSATGHREIAALLNANPTSPRHTVTRHH